MATVLLADTVELFLKLETLFLEGAGHRVVAVRSGAEVLARLGEVRPDILLIDLHLKDIGGDEICRRLRRSVRWRALPVIIVTAEGRSEEIRRCLETGWDDYLTKPVAKSILTEKVQRQLGKVRRRTAERSPLSLDVQISAGGRSVAARARDLSSTGIYVRSQRVFAPGTAVELKIRRPDGGELVVLGKVKRVQEGPDAGMGIYFIHPEAQGLKALAALVGRQGQGMGRETPPAPDGEAQRRMAEETLRLHRRIQELETENREFADQLVRIEELNNTLSNLYVASSRLHAVLHREQVSAIITEIVINFVGAEKFVLLVLDEESGALRFETGEGFESFPPVTAEEGIWRQVVGERRSCFREEAVSEGSDDPLQPIAAIPLCIGEQVVGVLALYRLFVHKDRFAPTDYQLFSMLAEQAATALFSAILYEESERKRNTYRGLMELVLK